jgi:hypothetical protein
MSRRAIALACALGCVTAVPVAHAERRWLRANFHGHASAGHVDDDGVESAPELHKAVRAAGFDFSLHTPHCVTDVGADAGQHFAEQRSAEAAVHVPGLTIATGQELSVVDGPKYSRHTKVLGRNTPGNLNHLTILGNKTLLPYRVLSPGEACERVHQDGGICIVNHPGPGPMMWEEGYWEAPKNRGTVDAIEVYNGQALAAIGIDFESRYREATAYRGLGLKIAATTGADTHGPKSVARAQSKVASFAGPARSLLKIVLPQAESARPELDAATLVLVDAPATAMGPAARPATATTVGTPLTRPTQATAATTAAVIAAVKARRTVAVNALPGLEVSVDGLGEVRKTGAVQLSMKLSRKLAEVTLYREGTPVQTWHDVDAVEWSETITAPAAYVFGARQGAGRLLTSAIWYEPGK